MIPLRKSSAKTLTGNNGIILDGSPDNHDGVVERPFGFLDELVGTAPQDQGAGLGLGASGQQVVSLTPDLSLFEKLTDTEDIVRQRGNGGLDRSAARLHGSLEILFGHTAGTEHIPEDEIQSLTNCPSWKSRLFPRCPL